MKPRKITLKDKEMRDKLKKGFDFAVDAVAATYGPGGTNVAIERQYADILITNDGATVAQNIVIADEIEDMGASFVRDLSKSADEGGGDGTTTATILAGAIVDSVWDELYPGGIQLSSPMSFAKKIKDDCALVCEKLREMARPIESNEDIYNVAFVSSESAEWGKMIANMYQEIGKDGHVYVERDYGFDIKTHTVQGYEIDKGMPSIVFSNIGQFTAEIPMANVALTNKELDDKDIIAIFNILKTTTIDHLVIFAGGFTDQALSTLAAIYPQSKALGGKLTSVIPVAMPVTYRDIMLQDMSVLTGASFVDEAKGQSFGLLSKAGDDFFGGMCKKIVIKKNKTYLIGVPNDPKEYIDDLKKQREDMGEVDQERMDKRIAKVSQGVGVIRVGGQTEGERMYNYHKIKDAVNATKLAIQDGVVIGGGMVYIPLGNDTILGEALAVPHSRLCSNIGREITEEELIENGIIDPVSVVVNSLQKACAAASNFITIRTAIANTNLTLAETRELELNM